MKRRSLFALLIIPFQIWWLKRHGWKDTDTGLGDLERIIAEECRHPEYLVRTTEHRWYEKGWQYMTLDSAFSTHNMGDGQDLVYIGSPDDAEVLAVEKGLCQIQPRLGGSGKICSIGFCPGDGKWYGWSHRAICGFGKGDKIFNEHWPQATEDTPFTQHGDKPIKTWEDAKIAASRLAASVA